MKKIYVLFPADMNTLTFAFIGLNACFFYMPVYQLIFRQHIFFDPESYFELKLQPSTKLWWCFLPENRKPQAGNGFNSGGSQRDTRDKIR